MNINICFALVLDPRCKIEFLRFTLSNLFGVARGQMHVEVVKAEMGMLYNEFAKQHSSTSSHHQGRESSSSDAGTYVVEPTVESEYLTVEEFNRQRLQSENCQGQQKTELDKYLAEDVDPYSQSFDVLLWWKVNSPRFPILSAMAKDVLVVPVSTVASESAFSTGRRVLSDFRSSLNPETVEALICAQDWVYPRGAPEPPEEPDVLDYLAELNDDNRISLSK